MTEILWGNHLTWRCNDLGEICVHYTRRCNLASKVHIDMKDLQFYNQMWSVGSWLFCVPHSFVQIMNVHSWTLPIKAGDGHGNAARMPNRQHFCGDRLTQPGASLSWCYIISFFNKPFHKAHSSQICKSGLDSAAYDWLHQAPTSCLHCFLCRILVLWLNTLRIYKIRLHFVSYSVLCEGPSLPW